MTAREVRRLWEESCRKGHEAFAAESRFKAALAELNAAMLVTAGYAVDLLGDLTVKPVEQCARMVTPEKATGKRMAAKASK